MASKFTSSLALNPKPKEIEVETFRIDYLIRGPKVEKLSLEPIRFLVGNAGMGYSDYDKRP